MQKNYKLYIFIIILIILLIFFMYKTILMYLLFNNFYIKPDIYNFINKIYKTNNFYNNKYENFLLNIKNVIINF